MDSRVLPTLRVKVLSGVQEFNATQWQMLSDGSNPFVSHGFLATLEESRCVGGATGWQPNIVALYDSQGVAAAAPSYLKAHSYGEFVFDFAWAQAYSRHGLAYYPKMIVAVPFTPATGPRLLIRADLAREPAVAGAVRDQLRTALQEHARERGVSSVHLLFHLPVRQRRHRSRNGWRVATVSFTGAIAVTRTLSITCRASRRTNARRRGANDAAWPKTE